jgi:hypothetical protein
VLDFDAGVPLFCEKSVTLKCTSMWGRNGFDGIESLCEGVSGSELP